MDMNDRGRWTSDDDLLAGDGDDAVVRLLVARAESMRQHDLLADRVFRASVRALPAPSDALPFASASRRSSSSEAWRWGAGVAVAASMVAALFVGVTTQSARSGHGVSVADRFGVESEPVLVALIAGSELVEHESPSASELLAAEAMPILRSRDASFRDLDSEVRLVIAGGGR